jgi:acetyl esterase/lipase
MWPRRTKLMAMLRGMLLLDTSIVALLSLLTAIKCPLWLHWVVGMVVPECALWISPLPVVFAAAAWFLRCRADVATDGVTSVRGGRQILTVATLALCGVAIILLLKPAAQAWWLGRSLPAQLDAAFAPIVASSPHPAPLAHPRRAPFSLAASLEPSPQPVPIETMEYARGLLLDLYRPLGRSSSAAPAACIVVIHGGSWVSGNRLDNGTKRVLNDYLARRGYAVVSIDYRLAPEHVWPAQREDLLAALGFLRERAAPLGIDPGKFVLLGRSAGAQIATAGTYAMDDPRAEGIRGVISFYTPTDFRMTWDSATQPGNLDHRLNLEWFLGGTPESAAGTYDSASAATLVRADAPPTLILHGVLDVNVFHEHAQLLDDRLAAANVPHALVTLPWAAHAFDLVGFNTPGGQISTYAVERFVESVTR